MKRKVRAVRGVLIERRRRGQRRFHLRSDEERLLRTVMETLPVGVWIADAEGRIIEANPTARQLWGGGPPTVSVSDYAQRGWRADTGEILKAEEWPLPKALRTGEAVPPQEFYILSFDHRCRTIQISAVPIRDDKGELIGAVAVDQDISERKRAEEQIRSLAEFSRENPHPLLRLRPMEEILFANDRAAALMEEEKRRLGELLPKELLAAAEEALRTGEPTEVEVECAEQRTFSFFCAPVPGKGYVNLYGRDVTDRVRTEQALRQMVEERERLLRQSRQWSAELDATIKAIAAPLIVYDREGGIASTNPAAERLLAYSAEMRAKPLTERTKWLHVEAPDGNRIPLERTPVGRALQGETVIGETLVFHFPGRTVWGSVSAAPIHTSEGENLGAVVTLVDITPLHDLQREREMFSHTISHDLRNPLTVIAGHAQLMAGLCPGEEAQLHLNAILTSAGRMTRMIEDLVEAARLEGGEIKLQTEAIRLDQFLADFLRRSATALDTSRIVTEVPVLPAVTADLARLERILANLLTNALKFSPPDSKVEVRARQSGETAVVSVHDHGRGIDPEDLPHIFDRFFRSKEGKKPDSVGLGLYITRSLVEAHGGQICAESTPGVGSGFYFTLPLSSP